MQDAAKTKSFLLKYFAAPASVFTNKSYGCHRRPGRKNVRGPTGQAGSRRDTHKPATLPRRTVIEAFGRVNVVCGPAVISVPTGGASGSGWLFGPSLIHTYCSLPKVTSRTLPVKEALCLCLESSNEMRTWCAFLSSRLTSISDQFPSGRRTA